MGDSSVYSNSSQNLPRSEAGMILRIRMENFMCHSNLQIELGEWINFITGQNGSGKSAILTALCVAFGCRAKATDRASTLKAFIKTGCSYAVVHVEMKNEGVDAFKQDIYGDVIIIERRITDSTSTIVLKDQQGRKVASRRGELRELVEHFNIDVENPCVIMSQDKSREFLHSGNDKDKFKFFFKATLLQQLNDLLQSIFDSLSYANALVDELEASIRPIQKELSEMEIKIKNIEHMEEVAQQVQLLRKQLAWSLVYEAGKQVQEQCSRITKLKNRIPTCQQKINTFQEKVETNRESFTKEKKQIDIMMQQTSTARRKKDELQQTISMAKRECLVLKQEIARKTSEIQNQVSRLRKLEDQVRHLEEEHVRNTQVEESEIVEQLKSLQYEVDTANSTLSRLKEDESALSETISAGHGEIKKFEEEIQGYERKHQQARRSINKIQEQQTNKVTAFGGPKVMHLLHAIEMHRHKFQSPPIGPIGAHVTLNEGDTWAIAVEAALGKLLNAFIVTSHADFRELRICANKANYSNLQIIIYDFSRLRLNIPQNMLPQTHHPTTLSVINCDNHTVINVLVDMGHAERQVLVKDYNVGRDVTFNQRIHNLKEVFTLDGTKMFSRNSVQTILPPNKNQRHVRLSGSFDAQIKALERDSLMANEEAEHFRKRKRESEEKQRNLSYSLQSVKKRCREADYDLSKKKLALQDASTAYAAENRSSSTSTVDELYHDISNHKEVIGKMECALAGVQVKLNEAIELDKKLALSFEQLCESAQEEIDAFEKAEENLLAIEQDIKAAEGEKVHYEKIMRDKVLPDIKRAEEQYSMLQENLKESNKKASTICPENEVEALDIGNCSTTEKLTTQLNRLEQRLQRESNQYSESIDDLRMLYAKKERKISKKRRTYSGFRAKLNACSDSLESRWKMFERTESFLKRQMTWRFNSHLRKKGISGHIKIRYDEQTLSVEIKMPQDASSKIVRDTRGLSGGERSFSTLCFALALHDMTEAPFRAMDEFDVFMDAVSRKISLDTLVDFAEEQGAQWIFITPHDISMVRQGERIKKQQMAAPRS